MSDASVDDALDLGTVPGMNISDLTPLSASGPSIAAAGNATVGTPDTINSLITSGMGVLTSVVNAEEVKGVVAAKATTQLASQGITATTMIVIAIIAVIGFIVFAKTKFKG